PPILRLAPQQPSYKILAVDDILESRLLLSEILNGVGFQVKEAENGLQAVELCQTWKPDLIFMDMRMPVMNGLKATQIIKADLCTHKTLIIALTASAFEEDRAMLLEAGCDDFIRKPFQREQLLEKVKQYLKVEYIYQEGENREIINSQKSETLPTEDIKLHLEKMPSQWIKQLHEYASQCSDTGILVLLKEIPPENIVLTDALTLLVYNFEFDKILALLVLDK
ncbi:MAG: response regulator, partial [Planktothrix sp.]